MSKVTLRILAEETGLSKFAVSRALSGKSGVSDATRSRVIEAAQRLGYRLPDAPSTSVLGVIFDDRDHINAELNMQIQSGLQSEAAQLGYGIRVHWMQHGEEFGHLLEACSGLLAVNLHSEADIKRLQTWGRPIVRSGWIDPLEAVDTVSGTDHEAGAAAAHALLDLGHREIAYVHGSENLRGRWERLYGLREVVETTPNARYHHIKWSPEQSFAQCLDHLLGDGIKPTAFFCSHDGLALTVVTDLLRRGWRIPESASVMGFGDFSAAQLIHPALTTIRTPGRKIGMAAVRLLDARIRNPDWVRGPVRVMIPNEFVRRSSTGPAPAR